MTQLVRTTNELIVNSLYLIGELAVGESPDAFMISSGLEIINELLDKFSMSGIYIPYITSVTFNFVAGRGTYSVSDMIANPNVSSNRIVSIENGYYDVPTTGAASVRYYLSEVTEGQFDQNVTQPVLSALPSIFYMDNVENQTNVTFYPQPQSTYSCTLRCRLMLQYLGLTEDLNSLPPYYYGFLKYALARKFLAYYPGGNWGAKEEDEYNDYYSTIKMANQPDITITPSGILEASDRYYIPNLTVV